MILIFNQLLNKIPIFKRIYPSITSRILNMLNKNEFIIRFKKIILQINIKDPIDKEIFFKNAYEEKQTKCLFNFINIEKPNIFLDVGANSGIYSLRVSRLFKNLKIFAFEPIPATYKKLLKNIQLNRFKNIKAYKIGISNTSEKKKMIALKRKGYVQSGGFSFKIPKRKIANDEVLEFHNTIHGDRFLKFKKKKIFIKIDVEGYEKNVILGIKNLLKKNKTFIQIEIFKKNFNKINLLLKKYNFVLVNKIKRTSDYFYKNY